MPRYTSTLWIGSFVTESITFPVIVPVIAAAGLAGSASVSSRHRTTSAEVAARRKSVELILDPSSGMRRECGAIRPNADCTLNYRVAKHVSPQLHLTN